MRRPTRVGLLIPVVPRWRADGFNHPGNLKGFLIDGLSYSSSRPPASANLRKNDGWKNVTRADGSTFKNQGDCIQYVNTGK